MRYLFDGFVLNAESRELLRAERTVPLAPQVFDLLVYLVRNRERAVSKDDLIDAIWGGRVVTDAALTTRINVLRGAIGDSGSEQRLLKTLPRIGYRFVGTVLEDSRGSHAPTVGRPTEMGREALAGRPSVMVMPFINLSDHPGFDALSNSVPEDVATELIKRRETTVVASSANCTSGASDPLVIGRERGARYVLAGTVRGEDVHARVTVRLTDATSGVHTWGRYYDLTCTGNPVGADTMIAAIVTAVSGAIRNAELRRLRYRRADELGAWDAYQFGLWHMSKSEAADNRVARSLFQQAVQLDPNFGPGYAAIAFTYTAASSAFSELSIAESCEVADPLVRKAIALDETDTEARSRLALLALLRGDLEGAVREADDVIGVHERCPDAWGVKGAALSYAGRRHEGRAAIKHYFSFDPIDIARPIRLTQIASSLYLDGGYEEAAQTAQQVIRRYPRHPFAYRWRAAALGQLGRSDEAQEVLRQLQAISPSSFDMYIRQRPPPFCSGEYAPMLEGLNKMGWRE